MSWTSEDYWVLEVHELLYSYRRPTARTLDMYISTPSCCAGVDTSTPGSSPAGLMPNARIEDTLRHWSRMVSQRVTCSDTSPHYLDHQTACGMSKV